jgi:hypothetical protein
VVAYYSLQLAAKEVTQPPGQIRHRQSLITDMEVIDKPEISQIPKKRSNHPKRGEFPTPQKSGQFIVI